MRSLFFILPFLILSFCGYAQTLQWARSSGSDSYVFGPVRHNSFNGGQSGFEAIGDMATDPNGNVYGISLFAEGAITVDGRSLNKIGGNDIVVSSYTCDGQYRWSKVLGSSLDSDRFVGIRTDGKGGVYACVESSTTTSTNGLNISTDTIVAPTTRTMYLIKWDTSGKFQWVRMPQPTNISGYNANTASIMMGMDIVPNPQGDSHIYLLGYLAPAYYGGAAFAATTSGVYVLEYDENGTFIKGVPLPMTISGTDPFSLIATNFTVSNGNYIVAGNASLSFLTQSGSTKIGTTTLVSYAGYVASFGSTGNLNFLKNALKSNFIIYGVLADEDFDIYISGMTSDSAAFNGVSFYNSYRKPYVSTTISYAMKLDGTTGNTIWTQSAHSGASSAGQLSLFKDKVFLPGYFVDSVAFTNDSISNRYVVDSFDCFILQLDAATGAIQRKVTFGTTANDYLFTSATDQRGNVYVGGSIANKPLTIGSTVASPVGGKVDALLVKWGRANCDCVLPIAKFTSAAPSGKSIQFTFSGTATGVDSLVWNWGDGQTQKVTTGFAAPISHTYSSNGKFKACVTVYTTNCGEASYCSQAALGLSAVPGLSKVQVYPNPTSDFVTISGAIGASAVLFNSLGQELMQFTVSSDSYRADLKDVVAGLYLLQVTDKEGNRGVLRVAKR